MAIRDLIVNNFWWKVTALLLAVGAWFGLTPGTVPFKLPQTGVPYATRELVAHPITITKEAADTREFKVTPATVDITISGGDDDSLRALNAQEIRPTVDLRSFDTNMTTADIVVFIPEKEKLGVKLVKLVPNTVQVELVKE